MWASTLLSPYLHPKIRSLTLELYESSHTNAGCALAYIPSLVGVASIWAAILRRGNRAMHGKVVPYNIILFPLVTIDKQYFQILQNSFYSVSLHIYTEYIVCKNMWIMFEK